MDPNEINVGFTCQKTKTRIDTVVVRPHGSSSTRRAHGQSRWVTPGFHAPTSRRKPVP